MSRYSILFFVFFSQLIITSPSTLVGRFGHTASYMDNKIYFLGGGTGKYPNVDLSNDARQIHPHYNGLSTICGPTKDTIFLIDRVSKENFSYKFINNKEWVLRNIKIIDVQWSSAACYKNGLEIFIYGSLYDVNEYVIEVIDTTSWNSMIMDDLNTNNYLAPPISLPDGSIAYIGERINDFLVNLRNIHMYDTNYGTWGNMIANGKIPSPRNFHTTVLTQDGLIIIYGGINDIYLNPVPDQISVLDTKVKPFTWFTPNIDSAPSTAPFKGHTATLVGNYMIIAFGYYYSNTTLDYSDQIHMIDVSEKNNYKWVKSFTPNITKTAYPTKSAIIGGTTGGIATIIIIVSVSYLLYRRKRTVIYAPQAKHAINC